MKTKTLLFNPVHPVKKIAATLLLSAGLGLSLSGSANAAITTTASGIIADDNDLYSMRQTGNFEYLQIVPGKVLTITVTASTTGMSASLYGSAFNGVTLATAGNVTFANCYSKNLQVSGNNNYRDGGAAVAEVITHAGSGTLVFGNNTGMKGGALYSAGSLTINGDYDAIVFADNTSYGTGDSGGGGAVSASTLLLNNSVRGTLTVSGNASAQSTGGAFNAGNITLSGTYGDIVFSANNASGSGGVLRASDNIELNSSVSGTLTIRDNIAASTGGAFDAGGTIALRGSYGAVAIVSNTGDSRGSGGGGAFYASKGLSLSATVANNLVLANNSVKSLGSGGLFYANEILFNNQVGGDLTISGNRADNNDNTGGNGYGGALYGSNHVVLSDRVAGNLNISGNVAYRDGGAFNSGTIELRDLVGGTLNLSGNAASCHGGALSASSITLSGSYGAMLISSNTAGDAGGAFRIGSISDIILTATVARDLTVSGNSAKTGGAFITDGSTQWNSTVGGNLNLSGNVATNSDGGAINSNNPILLTGNVGGNLSISGNRAGNDGGAIRTNTILTLSPRVTGTLSISGNTAGRDGGALVVTNAAYTAGSYSRALTVSGSYGAILISSNTATRNGGAWCAPTGLDFSTTVANNLSVSGNRAGQDGGAFFASQNLTLNHRVGGTLSFSGNVTDGYGGAVDADGTLSFSGSHRAILISSNTAGASGGAFYAGNGLHFSATAASISVLNNRANNGGAFFAENSFNLTLAASSTLTASGNKASTYGGFVYTYSGSMLFNIGTSAIAQIGNANSIANQTDTIGANTNVSLYKTGAGTLQLWADNTYPNNTYVSAGVLDLRGKLASARVEINNGATLKGSGTVSNSVVIYSGGTLAPGDGPGVLTTGALTLNDGAALSLNLAAASGANHTRPAGNSLLVVNGNLTSVGTAQIDLTLTAGPVNGAVYDLIKYSGTGSGNVNIRKLSGSGATGVKISDFKIVNSEAGWLKLSYSGTTITTGTGGGGNGGGTEETWDLAGLTSKGLKLSAAKTLVVPKGVKLLKGTKAIYTWKRDGATVLSGSGKNFTAKDSGTYTLTLSYTTADGQPHSQTQTFGKLKLFAQPKTVTLSLTQTTDTITNSALRGTSVVSGETLKLTVNVGTVGGGAVGPFRYVWYCGSAVVRTQQSSATADTFTTPAYGDKAVGYKCVVELVAKDAKNKPLGTAKSKDLKAKIILPPSAVTLKLSANPVKENGTLTLSATAKGTATLLFTWYKNGQQIATGSAKKFAKKPVSVSDAGVYYVVVSQDKTNRRAQSATLTVSVQRADGTTVSGAQPQSAPMTALPAAAAATSSADPRRQDAAATLGDSAALSNSAGASIINLAPLKLSAGDMLTVSGSATREYLILSETQHSTGAYRYEWRDNLTAEFQDADDEAQLTLRFITSDGGVYELSISGSVNETGVFELRKK